MSRLRLLVQVATVAGPAVLKVVSTYGPEIRRLIKENPELFDTLRERVTAIASARRSRSGSKGLSNRVNVLREQTAYLYASANNVEMAEKASRWRTELDQIEKILPVVESMERKEKKARMRKLEKQLDAVAGKIVEATLEDDIEDAEIVSDEEN